MAITAWSGPLVGFGISQASSGAVNQYNEERGPSVFDLGQGTMDPRSQYNYKPGSPVGTQIKVLFDQTGLVDYNPGTSFLSTNTGSTTAGILPSSLSGAPVAGTALTLAPQSSQGAIQTTIIAPETGQAVSVIAIDSTAATLNFGQGGTVAVWNPAAGTGRAILVINSCNSNSEQYIVRGRDMYGFKMTETILASTTSSGSGQGRKAFKYITSVTPSTATTISATGVGIGVNDIFGLPLVASYGNGISIWHSSANTTIANIITLATSVNFTVASTATTQTSTMPDVRGTYTSSALVSNGSSVTSSAAVRLTISQYINANMVAGVTAASAVSMFGQAQFSDF